MKIDFSKQTGRIITTTGHQKICVHVENIIYIKCVGELATIYLHDKREVSEIKTLKAYEEELCGVGFIKIYRNTIINGRYITKIIPQQGKRIVILGDIQLKISKRLYKWVKMHFT